MKAPLRLLQVSTHSMAWQRVSLWGELVPRVALITPLVSGHTERCKAPAGPSCSSSPECCLFIPLTAPSFLHYKLPAASLGMHHGVRSQPQYRRSGRFIYYRVCLHSYLRPCLARPSITHTSACCPSHPQSPSAGNISVSLLLCLSHLHSHLSARSTPPPESSCFFVSISPFLEKWCAHFFPHKLGSLARRSSLHFY